MAIPNLFWWWSDVTPYFAHQLSAKRVLKTAKPLELQPWPCTVVTVVATVILIDHQISGRNNFDIAMSPDPLSRVRMM